MCILCAQGRPQNHFGTRRSFLKGAAAIGIAAAGGRHVVAAKSDDAIINPTATRFFGNLCGLCRYAKWIRLNDAHVF